MWRWSKSTKKEWYILGIIFVILGILMPLLNIRSVPDYSELNVITGSFVKFSYISGGKWGVPEIVLIDVDTGKEIVQIRSLFPRNRFKKLTKGSMLEARISANHILRPSVQHIYELRSGGEMLISYKEKSYNDKKNKKNIHFLSPFFIVAGILLCLVISKRRNQ
ncbi:MAG: hypothetical protein GY707_07625 [Desulfobacteraceae bacterium]|nr:hypothetical protein [Desulfobacteraceae bacterium]